MPLVKFLANDMNVPRSIDPDPYTIATDLNDRDFDLAIDLNLFTSLSAEYQHDIFLHEKGAFEGRVFVPYPVAG
jgi:hypothetical protein